MHEKAMGLPSRRGAAAALRRHDDAHAGALSAGVSLPCTVRALGFLRWQILGMPGGHAAIHAADVVSPITLQQTGSDT